MGKGIDDILNDLKGDKGKKEPEKKGGVMSRKKEKEKTIDSAVTGTIPIKELTYSDDSRPIDVKKVKEYTESIKQVGLLVPIFINGDKVVMDGQHRIKACEELGIKEIPFIVIKDKNVDQVSIIANYMTNRLEEEQVKEILERAEGTQKEKAKMFGFTQARVSQILSGKQPRKVGKKGSAKESKFDNVSSSVLPENVTIRIYPKSVKIAFTLDMEMEKTPLKSINKLFKEIHDFKGLMDGRR